MYPNTGYWLGFEPGMHTAQIKRGENQTAVLCDVYHEACQQLQLQKETEPTFKKPKTPPTTK